MNLDYPKKTKKIIDWLQQTVQQAGFKDVVIALSGGIDSALSASLAVKALGKEHVHVLLLPYGSLSEKSTQSAKIIAEFLKLPKENIHVIDIAEGVDTITHAVIPNSLDYTQGKGSPSQDKILLRQLADQNDNNIIDIPSDAIRQGNIMARVRMIYLYDFAKNIHALVVGTENKTENYLGYFTRFGDEASDIEPILGLYKTQVKEMARFMGIPKEIIDQPPTAGLWEGQTDEGEFGFTYEDADRVLFHYVDEGLPEEAITTLGIPEGIVKKVLARVAENDFKHNVPKVFEH